MPPFCNLAFGRPLSIAGSPADPPSGKRRTGSDTWEKDQARRRYLKRYFDAEIDDPTLYDVTLNTARFGFARAAEVIAQLALERRHAFAEHERAILTIESSGLSG